MLTLWELPGRAVIMHKNKVSAQCMFVQHYHLQSVYGCAIILVLRGSGSEYYGTCLLLADE